MAHIIKAGRSVDYKAPSSPSEIMCVLQDNQFYRLDGAFLHLGRWVLRAVFDLKEKGLECSVRGRLVMQDPVGWLAHAG